MTRNVAIALVVLITTVVIASMWTSDAPQYYKTACSLFVFCVGGIGVLRLIELENEE